MKERESVLEIELVAVLLAVVVGLAVLVVNGVFGKIQRGRRKAEGSPSPGSVPDERHQHTSSVSAR